MAITIPDEMRTLLKSKIMVGDNRPDGMITIEGAPSGGKLEDPTTWSTWRTFVSTSRGWGNMCETSNGRAVIVYVEGNDIKLAYADTVAGVLDGTKTFNTSESVTLASSKVYARTSITLVNSQLCVVMTYKDPSTGYLKGEFWRDTDGTGTGMAKVSDISLNLSSTYVYNVEDAVDGIKPSQVHLLGNGNLVCTVQYKYSYYDSTRAFYSSDNGATWTAGAYVPLGITTRIGDSSSGSFLILSDSSFVTAWLSSNTECWIIEWTNSGANAAKYDWTDDWGTDNGPWFASFIEVAGDYYINKYYEGGLNTDIYKLNAAVPNVDNIKSISDWTFVKRVAGVDFNNQCYWFTLTSSALIMQHSRADKISGAGTAVAPGISLPIKSIEVDMSKGMASQATIVLDNKDGVYSPDNAGDWYHKIWPNKIATVKLGYGATLQTVFTGMIDKIIMRTWPQELEISCRDMLKRALDQLVCLVADEITIYTVLYQWQTLEYIFRDLAVKASWADADVITEISGITLESITFTHESFADAFQRLCEIGGFEFYCDEAGRLYFVHATDRQPAITSASTVLNGTNYTDIAGIPAGHPMTEGSVIVKSSDGLTTYIKDTDYVVRLGGSEGNAAIARTAGSTIPDGATVKVSCVYAAWVFQEGRDIMALDYTICDQDMYSRIIVISQNADGAFVRGDEDFGGVRYYDVLPHKVIIMQAGDLASTNGQCTTIAQRTGAASMTKPREANFEAVGNPYVQVGDCIQVIESSTTISEIYRITSMSHTLTPEGFKTRMTCYHYGYAPI